MHMADKRICVYFSQRGHDDSPPSADAEVVYETLIVPVMDYFPDFAMNPRGYIHEPGSISSQLIEEIRSADLVIADLTGLSPSGYFELGARDSLALPNVFIAEEDYVMAVDVRDFLLVRYPFQNSPATAGDQSTVDSLVKAIREALDSQRRRSGPSLAPLKGAPKEQRLELAERIDEATHAISLLRINSIGGDLAELHAIARDLRNVPDEKTPSALQDAANAFLKVIVRIADQLATVRGSRIVIAGGLGLVVGGAGWPAVTAMGLSLAFWEGKEAFLKGLERFGRKP